MDTIIYLDLDGVFVDLHAGLERIGLTVNLPHTPENKIKIDSMWDVLPVMAPNFWLDLKPMPRHQELYAKVLELCPQPHVLSATPESYTGSNERWCAQQKTTWVYQNIDKELLYRTIISKSKLKHFQIGLPPKATRKILIDDHASNIRRWRDAGGIAIHHTDMDLTLAELERLKNDCY